MKSILKRISQAVLLMPVMVLGLSFVAPAAGAACSDSLNLTSGAECAKGTGVATNLFGDKSVFSTITNILLFLIGAIAVVMLIIGGIRYVISGGDQAQVTSAKNTILYAIVGIIVAFLAYAAINFVTGQLNANANG